MRIPKSGSSKVVRCRDAMCGLFVEEGCFLLDALESRVHFEHLSECLSTFGSDFVSVETASKEEAEGKEVGKGEANVSGHILKERIKQGRPRQECKVWFVFVEERCFLLDALESRVHFEHLSECLSGFGSEVVVRETASKEEAKGNGG